MNDTVKKVRLTTGEEVTLDVLAERVTRRVWELWQAEARRERERGNRLGGRVSRRAKRV